MEQPDSKYPKEKEMEDILKEAGVDPSKPADYGAILEWIEQTNLFYNTYLPKEVKRMQEYTRELVNRPATDEEIRLILGRNYI